VPLLGYGAWITTACFGAGVVVTWVRFESLAGVGSEAVVAADRGDIFAVGLNSLFHTLVVFAIAAFLLLGGVVLWTRLKQRPARSLGRVGGFLREAGVSSWRYVTEHPWRVHVFAPVIGVALARFLLPRELAVPAGIACLASMLGGVLRAISEVVVRVAEGRSPWARRARVPALLVAIGLVGSLLFNVASWTPVATTIMAVIFAVIGYWRNRDIPVEDLTLSLLVTREWRLMAALFVIFSLGNAVASEADRPGGLTVAKVTPVQGAAFDAIPLGQHSGRAVFLNLATLRPRGLVEIAAGSLKRVAVTRTGVYGPKDGRTFARRILDWAREQNWAIQESAHSARGRR
jgi:hypothetical protein